MKKVLTHEILINLFEYDKESGFFIRKISRMGGAKAGDIAGTIDSNGYRRICILGKYYRLHRLVYFYINGYFPSGQIDHINGNKLDNRIENLRDVSHGVNQQNRRCASRISVSGYLGVSWFSQRGKWRAQICHNRKREVIGFFEDPALAHQAYVLRKREIHEGCAI